MYVSLLCANWIEAKLNCTKVNTISCIYQINGKVKWGYSVHRIINILLHCGEVIRQKQDHQQRC